MCMYTYIYIYILRCANVYRTIIIYGLRGESHLGSRPPIVVTVMVAFDCLLSYGYASVYCPSEVGICP